VDVVGGAAVGLAIVAVLDLVLDVARDGGDTLVRRRVEVAFGYADSTCMPLTSRAFTPQPVSTRCLPSALVSRRIASKRHGAVCGDVRPSFEARDMPIVVGWQSLERVSS
jgi:hypothetical protein